MSLNQSGISCRRPRVEGKKCAVENFCRETALWPYWRPRRWLWPLLWFSIHLRLTKHDHFELFKCQKCYKKSPLSWQSSVSQRKFSTKIPGNCTLSFCVLGRPLTNIIRPWSRVIFQAKTQAIFFLLYQPPPQYPDSLLAAMFDPKSERPPARKDSQGNFFIDGQPEPFELILQGDNSVEKVWLEKPLEKPLEFGLEIPYTLKS